MDQFDALLQVFKNLQGSAQNLSKDVDPKDQREETGPDLHSLSQGFQQLQKLYDALSDEDIAKIKTEVSELLSGKESLQEYARDVNAILTEVRARSQKSTDVQQKIQENLPQAHQNTEPDQIFQKYSQLINQVTQLISQKFAQK